MSDPFAREIDRVADELGVSVRIGVHYDTVSVGMGHSEQLAYLTAAQAEKLVQLFVRACWEAGRQGGAP
jgi:2-hydroxychromene-2-carboxylate isomerase